MKKISALVLLAVFLILPMSVKAAYLDATKDGNRTISADQVIKNGYIVGSNLNIDANTQKDLFTAGSSININGSVQNSLMAAGNSLDINGPVGDSVRVAGADITIENSIGGDALLAGNHVVLGDKSVIDGDLLMAANSGEIKGLISGDARIVGSDIIISGTITGDVVLRDVKNLTVTKDAVINGKLTYYSPNQAVIEDGAITKGSVDYHYIQTQGNSWKPFAQKATAVFTLYQIIGTILLLLLFIFISPKISTKFVEYSFKEAFKNFWWGLLVLIVAPVMALILLAISFKLTVIIFLAYFLLISLASVFSALLVGSWFLKTFNKGTEFPVNWQSIVLGVLIMTILGYLQIVGGVAMFALLFIALGSLAQLSYEGISQK